ncbi:MAG: hypothetical protein HPY90_00030 [Syntrophothermus sp.]|nr:hypothetical protein [Syntrophothermus sp.]NSW81653.1 hypothetical protein [Syntrophothermus sp.]
MRFQSFIAEERTSFAVMGRPGAGQQVNPCGVMMRLVVVVPDWAAV